jgi:hypothetical protein
VRQLVVGPNGDLHAALSRKSGDNTGGVLAFRDEHGDGEPDERASFSVRYRLGDGKLEPTGKQETVVEDLPSERGHKATRVEG